MAGQLPHSVVHDKLAELTGLRVSHDATEILVGTLEVVIYHHAKRAKTHAENWGRKTILPVDIAAAQHKPKPVEWETYASYLEHELEILHQQLRRHDLTPEAPEEPRPRHPILGVA